MNLRFKSIGIENFRSIQKADIDLENQGIVLVKGINEYEDKATSNGSGKSSIFEAIIYTLFEETSAGEKDVANRIVNNGYTLNLKFTVDSDEYEIQRQQKNNKTLVILYKNGENISARNKTDTNKLIQQVIGITKNIFLDSVFLSQNANTNLASLSPTARKERLEILTNTDYAIADFKESLKDVQNSYETNCVNDKLEINKLEGNKDSTQRQLDDINKKIVEIQLEIEQLNKLGNLQDIEKQIENIENNILVGIDTDIKQLDIAISQKESEIDSYRDDYENSNSVLKDLENQRQNKAFEWQTTQNEINNKNMEIKYKENHINEIENEIMKIANSDVCPTCGRKFEDANEQHIQQAINALEDEKQKIYLDIDNINVEIENINVKSQNIQSEGSEISNKIQECQELLNKKQQTIKDLDDERKEFINERTNKYNLMNQYLKDVNDLKYRKEQFMKSRTNNLKEYEESKNNILKEIDEINNKIIEYENEYEKNNEYVSVAKNAIQLVTKEFRTYLLQNSLQYLNKLLQKYSNQLFSNNTDIIKIVEDDTKLNIQLGNATYESLSGGEKTRVNIALLLAQKSLASIIGNITCNIIILDEILGYCDFQAEENVINLITSELDDLESIYMVSHKEIQIGYDKLLVIKKDRQGLSNVMSI